jgi:CubicO group peptidase (beta-lactamase class C family)
LFLLFLVALSWPADAQQVAPPRQPPVGPSLGEAVTSPAVAEIRLDSLAAGGHFSGTVLVAHGDRVLLRKGFGLADRGARTAMTPETMLNIGSITKAFTQVVILRLAQEGKLALDDPIGRYVEGFPVEVSSTVTIRQLLRHQGGMGDFFPSPMFRAAPANVRTLEDYLRIARATPLEFPPGTRERYSNLGYVTLGAVAEKASGMGWHDAIRQYVYGPAGMTSSAVLDRAAPGIATGYVGDPPAMEPNVASLPGRGSPAGGTYSTVDDLRRFALALIDGKLLSQAHTWLWFNEFEDGKRGWGPIGIAGGAPGINAELEFNPLTRDVVVVMANRSPPSAVRVAQQLARALPHWTVPPVDVP